MPCKVKLTQVFSLKPVQGNKGNREKPKIGAADLQTKSMLWPEIPRDGSAAAA